MGMSASAETALTDKKVMNALKIEECLRLEAPLRDDLELVDYEIRSLVTRILSEVDKSDVDSALFLKASATVLLSIAAGLLARAADQANATFDVDAFVLGAGDAAEWAKTRKLRYFLGGEA